jgi:hypothetical protein
MSEGMARSERLADLIGRIGVVGDPGQMRRGGANGGGKRGAFGSKG